MEDNDFTTDAILERLYGELAQHPEDDGPAPSQTNIRLLQHTEIAAFICLYREAGKLWVQMRIGYMFGTAASTRPRKDFRDFMMRPSHNPLRLLSGQSINLGECFVNDPAESEHRWGFDLIMDDVGFEQCAELIDYLLTTRYN